MINPFRKRPKSILLVDSITPWMGQLAPWVDEEQVEPDERARNWFLYCVIASLLLHFAILMIYLPALKPGEPPAASSPHSAAPLVGHLNRPQAAQPNTEQKQEVKKEPEHQEVLASKRPTESPVHVPHAPQIAQHQAPTQPQPLPVPPQPVPAPPVPDMTADLERKKAARAAADAQFRRQYGSGDGLEDRPKSPEEIARENIDRNLKWAKKEGGNGLIRYDNFGTRVATFKFTGWHPGAGDSWTNTYTVDAGEGGDVRDAVVKKEIEIIRKMYAGQFYFDSMRVGHQVPLSAAPENNAELQVFLRQELDYILDRNLLSRHG